MKYLPIILGLLGLVVLAALMGGGSGEGKRRAVLSIVAALVGVLLMAIVFGVFIERTL